MKIFIRPSSFFVIFGGMPRLAAHIQHLGAEGTVLARCRSFRKCGLWLGANLAVAASRVPCQVSSTFPETSEPRKYSSTVHRRTKVHEFSYNPTIAKKKKKDHPSSCEAKIQHIVSNTTYQHTPKKEFR